MAYASVASLMRTIQLVLKSNSPMQSLICDHIEEIHCLRESVCYLEVFLKNFERSSDSREMTDWEAQIKEVADVAEYTIQLRITEAVMANDEMQKKKAQGRLCDSLKQVIEEIDRVQKESTKIQDKGQQASKESLVQDSSSTKYILNVKSSMVGRDRERNTMLEELLGGSTGELKVNPIVGMGGIGKTTLAKDVVNDEHIRSHFDVRAWATVSKQHNAINILISLLRSRKEKEKDDTVYPEDESELAAMLKKSLKNRRYLILLDDVWSFEAWDAVRQCFPNDNKRSRILLTTRDTEVASYASAQNVPLKVGLMGPVESWDLFKSVAFANEALPSEFETIGKKIVDKCQGLPLTIVVVAGLLSDKRTKEDWENAAKDIMSFVTNDPEEQCLHVLGLSYSQLSSDLQACLLYFGVFSEDAEISAKQLVRLWSAEGFLKLEKELEGEAEKCLHDLINRCLVLVSKKSLDETKIRSCKVHDLVYELCLREAQSQNVFVMNDIVCNDDLEDEWDKVLGFDQLGGSDEDDDSDEDEDSDKGDDSGEDDLDAEKAESHGIVVDDEPNFVPPECRPLSRHTIQPCKRWIKDEIIDHDSYRALLTPGHHHLMKGQTDDDDNNLLKRTRSIFSSCSYSPAFTLKSELIHFNLLRILDVSPINIDVFPPQILGLIWLRYLVLSGEFDIPPEICGLWNLQTFIVEGYRPASTIFPEKIWELVQLRHLGLDGLYLPNPPSLSTDEESYSDFPNVHTVFGLSPKCCTKEVISGIRNIKKLGIYGDEEDYEDVQESRLFDNLVHLHQLETLSFQLSIPWMSDEISPVIIPSAKAFPATLKKLKLLGTGLKWEDLNIMAELPNLEVLKLSLFACEGQEWYPIAGGFPRLKLLLIDRNNLKYWKVTSDSFSVLERLVIRSCSNLEEIPIEFAEIYSLQLIELTGCTYELEASAAQIQQEQEELGNKPVDVQVYHSPEEEDEEEEDEEEEEEEEEEDEEDDEEEEEEDDEEEKDQE